MAKLRKKILQKKRASNQFAEILYQATDTKIGWIAKLGHYRDLIVHYVPISQAGYHSSLFQKSIDINNEKKLPSIMLPLPDNPLEIMDARNNNSHLSNKGAKEEIFLEEIKKDLAQSSNKTDALKYCSNSMEKLMQLSMDLVKYSPVKSNVINIPIEDIISFEKKEL